MKAIDIWRNTACSWLQYFNTKKICHLFPTNLQTNAFENPHQALLWNLNKKIKGLKIDKTILEMRKISCLQVIKPSH